MNISNCNKLAWNGMNLTKFSRFSSSRISKSKYNYNIIENSLIWILQ